MEQVALMGPKWIRQLRSVLYLRAGVLWLTDLRVRGMRCHLQRDTE